MQKIIIVISGILLNCCMHACEKSEEDKSFSKYVTYLKKKGGDFKDSLKNIDLPDEAFENLKKSKEYKDRMAIVRKSNQLFEKNNNVIDEDIGIPLGQYTTLTELFLASKIEMSNFSEHVKNIIKYAAFAGTVPVLTDLFKHFKIDLALKKNFLPIHWAAYGANLPAIEWFIKKRLSLVKEVTDNGSTPLHLACFSKKKGQEKNQVLETVRFLLDKGADKNALMFSDGNKFTPLDCALLDKDQTSQSLVKILKEAGALTEEQLQSSDGKEET